MSDAATPADQGWSVVVPTIGRPSLTTLLESLVAATADGAPCPSEVVVVDDRREGAGQPLDADDLPRGGWALRVLRSGGRGPAAARNTGWRATSARWTVLLDDDVELPAAWAAGLVADLRAAGDDVGGVQGRLHVPLPGHRAPTDAERGTAGLEGAAWATADMAYRRDALEAVAGFDERFPRAYREDADLALRVQRAGWSLQRGRRTTTHPVRPASVLQAGYSLGVQRGNADDALMRRLHGRGWREAAGAPRGRLRWHLATVGAAALALGAAVVAVAGSVADPERGTAPSAGARSGRSGAGHLALLGAGAWAALTADFALRRILPGPRDRAEVAAMTWTSAAIPFAALAHRVGAELRHARRPPQPWAAAHAGDASAPGSARDDHAPGDRSGARVLAVLFDRDGTLVHDVPYNGDPALVDPVQGAARAVAALRAAGVAVGVVTNQSGIGRGLITAVQAASVNAAVDAALGPFDTWQVCPHVPEDGCACRKPAPGMVLAGAAAMGVPPDRVAVVGDIGADVGAAAAAGALGVLVPNATTRAAEVEAAEHVAHDLAAAVRLVLAARR